MKIYTTIIIGNHERRNGNPIPKIKKTHGQHWTPEAKRYQAWKDHVLLEFLTQTRTLAEWDKKHNRPGKPVTTTGDGRPAHLHTEITWADETHGDPENVTGAIADALVENDKHLGITALAWHSANGKSETKIVIVQAETDEESGPRDLKEAADQEAKRLGTRMETRPGVERAGKGKTTRRTR